MDWQEDEITELQLKDLEQKNYPQRNTIGKITSGILFKISVL